MPLPVYDTKDAVPAADAADFVEYKGRWHQKDWVAATTEAERVKSINATLIGEKTTAEQQAAAEKARADAAEAAAKTGKTKEDLDAYAATVVTPVATERDTLKAENAKLKAAQDRTALEKLARSTKDTGLFMERLDDSDNMDILLRNVDYVNGQPVVMTVNAEGKRVATATPFAEHLKSFLPTKPWLYKHPGGSGGGMEHGQPGGEKDSPDTADKGIEQVNARRAAGHNPLAPQAAPPPVAKAS